MCASAGRLLRLLLLPADCWSLRKHGHRTEAQACFDGVDAQRDAYLRAEGFWGLEAVGAGE